MDGDEDLDEICPFGGRSFSIWDVLTELVRESGQQFEAITANLYGSRFDNDSAENASDGRNDDKGPEPETITVGMVGSRFFAFVGLERVGGIMAYDITEPRSPRFVRYINERNFGGATTDLVLDAGDLGPESTRFVPAVDSPLSTGAAMLIVENEISGAISVCSLEGP